MDNVPVTSDMLRSATKIISGWANYPAQPCRLLRPESVRDLRDAVTGTASAIPRGLGRSYGDAALNEGGDVILHERLDRMLAFDEASGLLDAEAGVSFDDVLRTFLPRGWFPAVTPGTKYVTLGGAIAADVHGKNHHADGSIANFVEDLHLLTASGDILRCSPDANAEAFWATLGGMGLTGAILSARIRLRRVESAYVTVDTRRAANLAQALDLFADNDRRHRYSVAWIDCLATGDALGRSVLMGGDHATIAELPPEHHGRPLAVAPRRGKAVPFFFPSFALSPTTVRAFNARYYRQHRDGRRIVDYETFFYPLDAVRHWNRIYGRRGFLQYQVVLPKAAGRRGLAELLEQLAASRRASFLAVLKAMGPQGQGLLSFPLEGYTLALDVPNTGPDVVAFLRSLDEIVLRHGGRVYLAKDAATTPESVARMYPNLPQFLDVKRRLDPKNRFTSSLARRVGIAPTPPAAKAVAGATAEQVRVA